MVTAECLGALALIQPNLVLPELQNHLNDDNADMRYTIIYSIKNTIIEKYHPIDLLLRDKMHAYFKLLLDQDRHVQKSVLQLFCSVMTHKFSFIQDSLQVLLCSCFCYTEFLI